MSTGLPVFDKTVQESNLWLKDLMGQLGTNDRQQAYRVLRATLHVVRDRIGSANATHLGAQLPMLLRGLYYEGWHMAAGPNKERHKQAFLDHVKAEAGGAIGDDVEAAVRAVFGVVWNKIDPGEVAKVIEFFPKELKDLWPRLARID